MFRWRNDGDQDIYVSNDKINNPNLLYRNNGDGNFAEQTSHSFAEVYYGAVAWGDYDNDGDIDILGCSPLTDEVVYWQNLGDQTFVRQQ